MHGGWTEKEIKTLRKNYPKKSLQELMDLIPNRCYDGIRTKARRLGLTKNK
tara:strand:+ start:434 stop:586 length:153 start_codon:yes stop_codon:yes gene_type:complete